MSEPEAKETSAPGAVQFLLENKRYWLVPLVLALLLLGVLAASSSASLTPFIYTVF